MNMVYEREANGDLETVGKRLEDAVKARKFGVIGVLDLQPADGHELCRIPARCSCAVQVVGV